MPASPARLARRRCQVGVRPTNVPSAPDRTYRGAGWQGWGHWLGSGNVANKEFLPFDEALAIARSLRLASRKAWLLWCKAGTRPGNVPSAPERTYKHAGWQGWGHWLSSSNLKTKQFLPFEEALAMARALQLGSKEGWKLWCKSGARPTNMPSDPGRIYKNAGWENWGHWLNSSNLTTKQFLPFQESLAIARALQLTGSTEWRAWSKSGARPANVPANPQQVCA